MLHLLFWHTLSVLAAPNCEDLKGLTNWKNRPPEFNTWTVEQRLDYVKGDKSRLKKAADEISKLFFAGTLSSSVIRECFNPEDRTLQSALSKRIIAESLRRLKNSGSRTAERVVTQVEKLAAENQIIRFQVFTHGKDAKAGFRRYNRSLFFNLAHIPQNEWNLILMHELAHFLDEDLKTSQTNYSDEIVLKQIFDLAKANGPIDELSKEHQDLFYQFFYDGMSRGLIAEFRAWTLAMHFYQESKASGRQEALPRYEKLLGTSATSIADSVFAFLQPRFRPPTAEDDPIFSFKSVQQAIDRVREDVIRMDKYELLGALKKYIHDL